MSKFNGRRVTGLFTILVLGAHAACSGGQSLGDNRDPQDDAGGFDGDTDKDASLDVVSSPRPEAGDETAVSQGLKIFVTARGHIADFIDDTELAGVTVIDKADAFCSRDTNKPDNGTYKALFVDGVNRSAKPALDWVLKPSTTYYLSRGNLVVGTTTPAAIFDAEYQPLTNPIGTTPPDADPDDINQVWTGIGNNVDFSTGNTCAGWTGDPDSGAPPGELVGSRGFSASTSGDAFYSIGDYGCDYFQLYLYCVEQ